MSAPTLEQKMEPFDLVDDFGRHIRFNGEILVEDSTDSPEHRKPQWTDTTIYRTEAGRYIVLAESNYRIRHQTPTCRRANGYELVSADESDTWACPTCNPDDVPGGYGQDTRMKVDVCDTPAELIARMSTINQQTGLRTHSHYAQSLLARVSELDTAVRDAWMVQEVG